MTCDNTLVNFFYTAGDFETVISVTTDGDMFIRINFQDGYRILDQTRLLIKFTDETGVGSRNMTSEQAFVNASHIFLELPRSRLPYQLFRVQVALQVGDEIGEFVSDGKIHGKHIQYGMDTCSFILRCEGVM